MHCSLVINQQVNDGTKQTDQFKVSDMSLNSRVGSTLHTLIDITCKCMRGSLRGRVMTSMSHCSVRRTSVLKVKGNASVGRKVREKVIRLVWEKCFPNGPRRAKWLSSEDRLCAITVHLFQAGLPSRYRGPANGNGSLAFGLPPVVSDFFPLVSLSPSSRFSHSHNHFILQLQ